MNSKVLGAFAILVVGAAIGFFVSRETTKQAVAGDEWRGSADDLFAIHLEGGAAYVWRSNSSGKITGLTTYERDATDPVLKLRVTEFPASAATVPAPAVK